MTDPNPNIANDFLAEVADSLSTDTFRWLAGKRICMVGKSGGLVKREWKQFAKAAGGLIVSENDTEVSLIIIGADSFPFDLSGLAENLKNRIEIGQAELIEETQFWNRCQEVDSISELSGLYTPAMLADLIGVQPAQVRRWHRRGLIRPALQVHRLPYFDFQEIATAKKLVQWLDHQSADQIEKKLTELAKIVPAARRSLSQLPIIVQGKKVLLQEIGGLVEPRGQKLFDFNYPESTDLPTDNDRIEALEKTDRNQDVVSLPISSLESWDDEPETKNPNIGKQKFVSKTSDQLLYDALEYEEEGQFDQAISIYRTLILADGLSADLSFQIAELLYRKGDLDGARERYFVAIELDDEFVEARASLGCLLSEQQQWELAVSVFEGALSIHPHYADVLFHLASCLDKLDRRHEADTYWEDFLLQAPNSPWAAYARARLNH